MCKHLRWSIYRCWQDIFSAAKLHDLSTAPDIWNAFRDKSFKFIFHKVVVTLKSRLQCSDRPLLKAWDTAWSCNDRKYFRWRCQVTGVTWDCLLATVHWGHCVSPESLHSPWQTDSAPRASHNNSSGSPGLNDHIGCQTSDSAIMEVVSCNSNFHHWPLLALLVALVLH